MVDVFVVSISPLMPLTCVLFVLLCFTLSCPGISEKYRLTKFVCYVFSVLLFLEDNQLNVFMT